MHFLSIATAATALVAPALAAPAADLETRAPAQYHWNVVNWHAGCARAGCTYDFNVTGVKRDIFPPFKAYCSGSDTGAFIACELLSKAAPNKKTFGISVAASLQPSTGDGVAAMSVQLVWSSIVDASTTATYTATGHHNATFNAFVAPLENFKVKPTEITAVA